MKRCQNRLMTPLEFLLVQGVPVPELLPGNSWVAEYYPFTRPAACWATHWRKLCGNCMHWSQVGSALMLAFARRAEYSGRVAG